MPSGNPKAVEDMLIKANELARKAMQFAATGVNIKKAVERFIVELEARKDIPPKMLYGVFSLVAPYDQSVRRSRRNSAHAIRATPFFVVLVYVYALFSE